MAFGCSTNSMQDLKERKTNFATQRRPSWYLTNGWKTLKKPEEKAIAALKETATTVLWLLADAAAGGR